MMDKEILLEKIKYLTSLSHSTLVEHCIYLEEENDNYKAQKYITDFITENGIICEKNKQIQDLTNDWNELEEFIQKELDNNIDGMKSLSGYQCKIILDKMKEIKNSN